VIARKCSQEIEQKYYLPRRASLTFFSHFSIFSLHVRVFRFFCQSSAEIWHFASLILHLKRQKLSSTDKIMMIID